MKLNGVRLAINVDSITRSNIATKNENDTALKSNSSEKEKKSDETPSNKHLKKFVEYVSYLKFLVTLVARDVNVRIDSKDDQDPISAATFEAAGKYINFRVNPISDRLCMSHHQIEYD